MPADDAHGSVPDEREIEAVWLCPTHAEEFWVPHGGRCPAPGCDEALVRYDRARDARRDEDPELRREIEELKAELRSPQGEEHEAGIEAAARALKAPREFVSRKAAAEEAIAAYLSRVSPSPERDTARSGLQALVDEARADDEWVGGNDLLIRVGAIVLDRLAEFPDAPARDARRDTVAVEDVVARLERIKLELRGTTAQGGDAECLIDSALKEFARPGADEP